MFRVSFWSCDLLAWPLTCVSCISTSGTSVKKHEKTWQNMRNMGTHHGHVPKSSLRSHTRASLEAVSVKVVGKWQWSQHHSNQSATKTTGDLSVSYFLRKCDAESCLFLRSMEVTDWTELREMLYCWLEYQKSTGPYGPLSSLGRSFKVNLGWRDEIGFGNVYVVPSWVGPCQSFSGPQTSSQATSRDRCSSSLETTCLIFSDHSWCVLIICPWQLMTSYCRPEHLSCLGISNTEYSEYIMHKYEQYHLHPSTIYNYLPCTNITILVKWRFAPVAPFEVGYPPAELRPLHGKLNRRRIHLPTWSKSKVDKDE